jgi:hypothetical protein
MTELDIPVFKLLFPKTSNEVLAKNYGVKQSTIRMWASKLDIRKQNGFYWTPVEERYLINYKPILTHKKIAEKLGRTKWGVIDKYRRMMSIK